MRLLDPQGLASDLAACSCVLGPELLICQAYLEARFEVWDRRLDARLMTGLLVLRASPAVCPSQSTCCCCCCWGGRACWDVEGSRGLWGSHSGGVARRSVSCITRAFRSLSAGVVLVSDGLAFTCRPGQMPEPCLNSRHRSDCEELNTCSAA